jgi:hypothetical protein
MVVLNQCEDAVAAAMHFNGRRRRRRRRSLIRSPTTDY